MAREKITDIAIDESNNLYGTTQSGLYAIDRTSAKCTFADGTMIEIEDAVTMKVYNGATRHYVSWNGPGPNVWLFDRLNSLGSNYVARVCAEVEP